jgi:hypothetical protein
MLRRMPNEERGAHLPPSPERRAAAARAGLFARSPLLAFGAALSALGGALFALGGALGEGLTELVRDGLTAASTRPDPIAHLVGALGRGAILALPLVLAPAAGAAVAAILPALVARRHGRGSTSVPLPDANAPALGRSTLRAAAAVAASLAVIQGFAAAKTFSVAALSTAAVAAGLVLVTAGLAELALERVRVLEVLKLTRSEARREERAAVGAQRARQALGASRREGAAP